jgi:predicted nucleic acid-binding protein
MILLGIIHFERSPEGDPVRPLAGYRRLRLLRILRLFRIMRSCKYSSLAEAGFLRLRWSSRILDETERAIETISRGKGHADAAERAKRARTAMETAFEDAMVSDFDRFMSAADGLPDPNDAHVVAAAIKTQASMIVTENLKHFPSENLATLNMEAKSAAEFIADTIVLDEGRAVAAIRVMRQRLNSPKITTEEMLLKMEAEGMQEAVDLLRPYIESI